MKSEQWNAPPLHSPESITPLDEADFEFIKVKVPSLYYVNELTQDTFNQLLQRLYSKEKQDKSK